MLPRATWPLGEAGTAWAKYGGAALLASVM